MARLWLARESTMMDVDMAEDETMENTELVEIYVRCLTPSNFVEPRSPDCMTATEDDDRGANRIQEQRTQIARGAMHVCCESFGSEQDILFRLDLHDGPDDAFADILQGTVTERMPAPICA